MTTLKDELERGAALASSVTTDLAAFLYYEARLLDEAQYDKWLRLWSKAGIYWIPIGDQQADPEQHVSIVYDDYPRLCQRVRRMLSDSAWALSPRPSSVHLLANIETHEADASAGAGAPVEAYAAAVIAEARSGRERTWFARLHYGIERIDDSWKLRWKTVRLVNNGGSLPTIGVLL